MKMYRSDIVIQNILFEQLSLVIDVFNTVLPYPSGTPFLELLNSTVFELPYVIEDIAGNPLLVQLSIANIKNRKWDLSVDNSPLESSELDHIWEMMFREHCQNRQKLNRIETIVSINTVNTLCLYMSLYTGYISLNSNIQEAINLLSDPSILFRDNKYLLEVSINSFSKVLAQPIKKFGQNIFIYGIPIYSSENGLWLYAKYKKMDLSNLPPYIGIEKIS